MPKVERSADVIWEGNVARGEGRVTAETGTFDALPFSLPSRIGQAAGKTSPEELLAAAHAGCFAMSLAGELTQAGTPPERLDVRATVIVDEVENAGHRIVASELRASARVPGLSREDFDRAVDHADEGCSFSALVKASGEVTVRAELES